MEAHELAYAAGLMRGALSARIDERGRVVPCRFTPAQVRELGGMAAWHPRLYRQMAACTAGIRLEFETDSAHLAFEAQMDRFPSGSQSMIDDMLDANPGVRPPYDGFSLDVDGKRLGAREPGADGLVRFAAGAVPGKKRRVRLWLPCLTSCRLGLVLGDGTYARPLGASRDLLVLGDSIAQGFTSLDPALTWPALLADSLGLGLVNQGVGGQVFQPGSVADAASATEPALVVVEFGANYRFEPCRAAAVERDATAYLSEVSRAWPAVPTLVLTPSYHTEDRYPTHPASCFADVARATREAAARHPQMSVVDGESLLPPDPSFLIDGSDHPGPNGQVAFYEKLRSSAELALNQNTSSEA